MMNNLNSRMNSRGSSSSSGSLHLIPDNEIEKYSSSCVHRDLFDMLIDEDHSCPPQDVRRTINELNLSPRSQSHPGCKCSKIDCLKMYCECFSKGRLCNERCECYNCCNKDECRLQIFKAQQLANFRHPGTFKGIPAFVPERRCTCKKSECRKNYCDCYRAGVKCTEECECTMCQNGKPHTHDFFDSRMEIEVNA